VAVPLLERLQLQVERRERLLLQLLRLGIRLGLKENALRLAPRPLDARRASACACVTFCWAS
jgi:hypothetical protein